MSLDTDAYYDGGIDRRAPAPREDEQDFMDFGGPDDHTEAQD